MIFFWVVNLQIIVVHKFLRFMFSVSFKNQHRKNFCVFTMTTVTSTNRDESFFSSSLWKRRQLLWVIKRKFLCFNCKVSETSSGVNSTEFLLFSVIFWWQFPTVMQDVKCALSQKKTHSLNHPNKLKATEKFPHQQQYSQIDFPSQSQVKISYIPSKPFIHSLHS